MNNVAYLIIPKLAPSKSAVLCLSYAWQTYLKSKTNKEFYDFYTPNYLQKLLALKMSEISGTNSVGAQRIINGWL